MAILSAGEGVLLAATDEKIVLASDSLTDAEFWSIVDRMGTRDYWQQPELLDQIAAMLPDYRLSKFQRFLPPAYAQELVAATVLDVPDTMRFLREEDLSSG